MRPLVAVAGMRSDQVKGLRRRGIAASEKVLEAVVRAGGTPVVLPPLESSDAYPLSQFRAVVIPGGRDIDPRTYGAVPSASDDPDLVQDRLEIQLVRDCLELDLPLLAICRGMQVVNVALGGDLTQDLPVNEVTHRNGFHAVRLEPGSLAAEVMGRTEVDVSTYHHQAVDALGEGLRVTGRTSDGCPEVLEHLTARFLVVQWHPEDDAETQPYEQALFDAIVDGIPRPHLVRAGGAAPRAALQ